MKRTLALVALILASAPSVAHAHGFSVYVSTPVTPPHGYEWVRVASLASILVSLFLCHWRSGKRTLRNSVVTALSTTAVFWILFVFDGYAAASATTAPPPGLGPPSAIYWHWRDESHWSLFTYWNFVGVAFLVSVSWIIGRVWKLPVRSGIAVLLIPVIVYGLFLTPFVMSKAISHGWAGGYVSNAGRDQLFDINRACFLYAKKNEGKFPVAQNIEELLPQITEHLLQKESRYGNPLTVHPAAWAFKEQPKPFTWNTSMSGKLAPELPIWDGSQLPVQCPYIGDRILPIDDLNDGR